jgi:hypothetical protein
VMAHHSRGWLAAGLMVHLVRLEVLWEDCRLVLELCW